MQSSLLLQRAATQNGSNAFGRVYACTRDKEMLAYNLGMTSGVKSCSTPVTCIRALKQGRIARVLLITQVTWGHVRKSELKF